MKDLHEKREGQIVLTDVCKTYSTLEGSEVKAADHVTLTIESEDTIALVGASGSGKSTLLRLVGLMDTPDSGSIVARGKDVGEFTRAQCADYRASIGFVFQQFHLIDSLSALQNVAAPLVGRAPRREHRDRALAALAKVGMQERASAMPWQLSGGQQQRVAIARALVGNPWLLLADEPTGNLDSANSAKILDLLLDLHESEGVTLLVATHDREVAARLGRKIEMRDGRAYEHVSTS